MKNKIVTKEKWLEDRKELLQKEKEFTHLRDELSMQRRSLPWVKVDQDYTFEGSNGKVKLADLFEDRSQLIIYHFMYGADWEEGCPSCSFWADNYNNIIIHLNNRDISFATVSIAPIEILENYRKRLDWNFQWYSSAESSFNFDFNVSFTPDELEKHEVNYNYTLTDFPSSEAAGISVFYKDNDNDNDNTIYNTYSCYSRGLDMLNVAYHYMDLVPKGRDEDGLAWSMEWLKRHDQYLN